MSAPQHPLLVDAINATFQGFFDRQQLEQEDSLSGLGVAVDDEFNFFISDWKGGRLEGPSFLRMAAGQLVWGCFQGNLPVGVVGVQLGEFRMFLCGQRNRRPGVSWRRDAVIINREANLFYMLELIEKQEKTPDLDLTQKISSQSSRADRNKPQWKVKIIDRCPLKSDGKLASPSKLLKNREQGRTIAYKKSDYTLQQQNYIYLVSTVLGDVFTDPSFINPLTFLRQWSLSNSKVLFSEIGEHEHQNQDLLFVSLATHRYRNAKQVQRKLGMVISGGGEVRSLGNYDAGMNLNGLAVQFNRYGETYIGIFRQNLLVKEYLHSNTSGKSLSTFPIRQILSQQHMKSMNYIHHCHYIEQLTQLLSLSTKLVKYVLAFEREYEKRHFSYNDTMVESNSSDLMNVMKYVDDERERRKVDYADQVEGETAKDTKKPGFILRKETSRREGESSRSPVGGKEPKSPLRQIRITGRISSSNLSPSERKLSPGLKSNASTVRRGGR